jgi:hypothetical protein
MINIIGEIIEKHSDEEIIAHLEKIVAGVVKNYTVALDKGNSDILWANLGDLTQVASILRGMRKRNEAR